MARRRPSENKAYAAKVQPGAAVSAPADKAALRTLARFERAKILRAPFEPAMQECYDYALPTRQSLFGGAPGQNRMTKIYDETAVVGTQEFASRIQSGLMPPFTRWANLEAGSDVPEDEKAEVTEALEGVTKYMFELIAESNLTDEIGEALQDLAVGTGFLEIEEGDLTQPIVAKALPIPRVWIDTGPDDRIDTFFREHHFRLSQARIKWPRARIPASMTSAYEAALKGEADPEVCFLECIRRDYESLNEEVWIREVLSPEHKGMLFVETMRGEGSCPIIGFRWAKMAGESWGRGPLQLAMPAIKTLNLTVELILENAEMAIAGLFTVEDDGVVNPDTISLVPGTLIPVAPGSAGLKAVGAAGNFDVAQLVLGDMRANVKKALFNDSLDTPGKTPRSATEVAQRQAELARAIGSSFARLMHELVGPVVQRIVYLLKKQKRFELPDQGGKIKRVRSTSPLARAQKMQDVSAFGEFVGLQMQLFGPQMVNLTVDAQASGDWLAEQMDIPKKLLRPKAEQQQLAQQVSEMSATPEPNGAPPPDPALPVGA